MCKKKCPNILCIPFLITDIIENERYLDVLEYKNN